jgi:hypothetical protein
VFARISGGESGGADDAGGEGDEARRPERTGGRRLVEQRRARDDGERVRPEGRDAGGRERAALLERELPKPILGRSRRRS